jgi:hypothetical protein
VNNRKYKNLSIGSSRSGLYFALVLAAAIGATTASSARAQGGNPAASTAAKAPVSEPAKSKQAKTIVEEIWLMEATHKAWPKGTPPTRPLLTAESANELRALPCVESVTAVRDAVIELIAVNGKPVRTTSWKMDIAGPRARGWVLPKGAIVTDTYFLSKTLASALGLTAQNAAVQNLEQRAFMAEGFKVVNGKQTDKLERGEFLVDAPNGVAKSHVWGYGGILAADPTSSAPAISRDVAVRFAPLFLPKATQLSLVDGASQLTPPRVYVRVKRGLGGVAQSACKASLDKHMQIWAKQIPYWNWELMQLDDE